MNRKIAAFLLTGLLLCVFLLAPMYAAKGFGDFDSDSDFGGDSDWGGSDYDSDWGGSDYDSRSSSRNKDSGGIVAVAVILWMCGLGIFAASSRNKETEERKSEEEWNSIEDSKELKKKNEEEDEYREFRKQHPEFSEDALFEYVRKLFTEMQEGWEAGDISNVKYGFMPDTWQRFDTLLSVKNQYGETTHVRDIEFGGMSIKYFGSVLNVKKIDVHFHVAYNVWTTNRKGKNIQGSPSTRHLMHYVWKMRWGQGPAKEENLTDRNHCPNCGAELDISAFAECPFCHTQIRRNSINWLIEDIQALSQTTIHK